MKLTAGQPKSILAGPIGQPEKKLSMTPGILTSVTCISGLYAHPMHSLYTCIVQWVICDLIYHRSIDKHSYCNATDVA